MHDLSLPLLVLPLLLPLLLLPLPLLLPLLLLVLPVLLLPLLLLVLPVLLLTASDWCWSSEGVILLGAHGVRAVLV